MEDPIINIKQAIRQLSECGVNTSELMSATLKAADMFREIKEIEDERIRKELLEQVECILPDKEEYDDEGRVLPAYHKRIERYRAYPEKQKEQKPSDKLTLENPMTGEKVYEREIPEFMRGVDPKDAEAIIHLAAKGWTVIAPGKEQQPAEKQDYSGLTDLERAIHRGFLCAWIENVSVTIIKQTAQECLAQMKAAEWSEEDKIKLGNLLAIMEGKTGVLPGGWKLYADWLKSLRPNHWKPSEEQMKALNEAINEAADSSSIHLNSWRYNLLKEIKENIK